MECRYAQKRQDVAGDLGSEKLQRECDPVEKDGRKGDGEDEDQKREAKLADHAPAEKGRDQAGHQQNEGDAGGK